VEWISSGGVKTNVFMEVSYTLAREPMSMLIMGKSAL
jgi:hypothetical protein